MLLNLLGLGFLLVSGARSLGETGDRYLRGFAAAWAVAEFPEEHVAKRQQLMFQASERFAQGHVHLMLALLQGVVAYLMKGQAAKGLMYTKLGATKLRDFAGWVQKNEARLVTMPALQPQASKSVGELVQEQRMAGAATERAAPVARAPQPGPKAMKPGTAEHKADRWARYQADGGLWGYQRWSKQYDTNMRNYTYGLAREEVIRKSMGGVNQLRKTPFTYRQIDVFNQAERYMGQIKTGRVSLTKDNVTAIRKDAWFVQRGFRVEHILEAGATKPYLDALTRAGISYRLGPYRSGD